MGGDLSDDAAPPDAGAGHDEWDSDRALVHVALAEQAVCPEHLAVVAGVHDPRVVLEPRLGERREHLADLLVEMGDEPEIPSRNSPQGGGIDVLPGPHDVAEMPYGRMFRRPVIRAKSRRKVDIVERIAIVEPARHQKGRVGAHVRHEESPRAGAPPAGPEQPPDGPPRDVAIVVLVGGVADARALRIELPLTGRGRLVPAASQQRRYPAAPIDHVHGRNLFGESVVVVGASEVELADRDDGVPVLPQAVHPALPRAVVGEGVVPVSRLVRVEAGGDGGARGAAEGARAVGVLEAHSLAGEPIKMRGAHEGMAVAAEHPAGMVVGEEEQEILRFGHGCSG